MSDQPPLHDHGSDRYDYIEISVPNETEIPPLPEWLTDDYVPCPDCRANLFLEWKPDGYWFATTAHDTGCPTMTRIERSG